MLPSGLPDQIDDSEDLARFLTQSSQFNSTVVKPSAFLPNPKDQETSASRHGVEPAETLWDLGRQAAGARRLYGAAVLKSRVVRETRLEVVPDEPPLRHAVIRNWPWVAEDRELQKAMQKELALVLASAAGAPILCGQ